MTMRARVLAVVVLGIMSGLWTRPASGQVLPEGFSSQTGSDLGGGVAGYDAAGNLYLLRPSWVTSSGQATLERISPSGERTALTVPLADAWNMAVAPDGRLFIADSRDVVLRKTDGTVASLAVNTVGSDYLQGLALTTTGTVVVGRNIYNTTAGQWESKLTVIFTEKDGVTRYDIPTPFQFPNAVRADRSGNVLALGSKPPGGESSQWTSGLVRVNPDTGETSVVSTTLSTSPVFAVDVAVDPAGQTLVSSLNQGILARRSDSGSLTTVSTDSFLWNAVTNADGSAVFVQGWKQTGSTTAEQLIQRVAADGTLTTVLTIPYNSSSPTSIFELAVDANGTPYGIRYRYERLTSPNNFYDIVRIADGQATALAGSESSTGINSLAIEADGDIVFSREDGIFRLTPDGTVTKLADPLVNSVGLGSFNRVRINPITGQIYVGGYDSGLAVLEADGTFTPIPLTGPVNPDGSTTPSIFDFTFDRDGNLILQAQDRSGSVVAQRLYRVNAQGGTLTPYDLGVSGAFWSVPAFDANGNVWFPTGESSIQYVNADGTLTPAITGILGFNAFSLTFSPDGTLLLSSQWGWAGGDALLITGFGAESGGGGGGSSATAVPALPAWALVALAAMLACVALRIPRRATIRVPH